MKVIRLVEAQYDADGNVISQSGLILPNSQASRQNSEQSDWKTNKEFYDYLVDQGKTKYRLSQEEIDAVIGNLKQLATEKPNEKISPENCNKLEDSIKQAAIVNSKSDVDINKLKQVFELRKFHGKGGTDAKNYLFNTFKQVGRYGATTGVENIIKVIDGYDFNFIKYFLESLKFENVGDKDNLTLAALNSEGAAGSANEQGSGLLANHDKNLFIKLYNVVGRSRELGLDANYIADKNAIIYDKNLYKLNDNKKIDDLVVYDKANPEQRQNLKRDLSNGKGNLAQYNSENAKYNKLVQDTENMFNTMSTEQKIKFMMTAFNLRTREEAVKLLAARGDSNK